MFLGFRDNREEIEKLVEPYAKGKNA